MQQQIGRCDKRVPLEGIREPVHDGGSGFANAAYCDDLAHTYRTSQTVWDVRLHDLQFALRTAPQTTPRLISDEFTYEPRFSYQMQGWLAATLCQATGHRS